MKATWRQLLTWCNLPIVLAWASGFLCARAYDTIVEGRFWLASIFILASWLCWRDAKK